MYETYRVRRQFTWRGWQYAPKNSCDCGCGNPITDAEGGQLPGPIPRCTGETAAGCMCRESICRCTCGIPRAIYAGDIWIVESGNPRKELMLGQRFATGDASIPPVDDLLSQDQYQRLLSPPMEAVVAQYDEEVARRVPTKRKAKAGTVRV